MGRKKSLGGSSTFEALHFALSSSGWLMRVLRSIVLPPTTLMVLLHAEVASGGAIRPQVVSDQSIGNETVFLQQLSHELRRGMLVPFGLDQHIKDLALGIDGTPQVDHAAIDLEKDLIQMPARVGFRSAFAHSCRLLYRGTGSTTESNA